MQKQRKPLSAPVGGGGGAGKRHGGEGGEAEAGGKRPDLSAVRTREVSPRLAECPSPPLPAGPGERRGPGPRGCARRRPDGLAGA